MNRKSVTRARRKEIMRYGTNFKEYSVKRDDEGNLYPKKDRGYCIHVEVGKFKICAPDTNRFEAIYAAWDCVRWALSELKKEEESQ